MCVCLQEEEEKQEGEMIKRYANILKRLELIYSYLLNCVDYEMQENIVKVKKN